MAALDILASLGFPDLHAIPPLQRILLITDGTLTEILEAHFLERIRLVKLDQQTVSGDAFHDLAPQGDEKFLKRKILLQGEDSGRIYVYAESMIAFERLEAGLRDALLASHTPLGRLWLEYKLETFKELIEVRRLAAGDLGLHFNCDTKAPLLMRRYLVNAKARPVMVINEYFPCI